MLASARQWAPSPGELAEQIIITDDNPRTEDPDSIVAAILEGTGRGAGVTVIRDRAAAIRHAIGAAGSGDVVLIAGKGHESVQVVGHESRPFSDQAVARQALAGDGMSMGRLSMVAEAVGGTLQGRDVEFDAVSTDTRSLQPGQLFFALRGTNVDGSAFLAEAARLGAAGAVVEARQDASLPQVEVADTRAALGQLARRWRARFAIPLIGITGSNGKTTVKEMTAAIMRATFGSSTELTGGYGIAGSAGAEHVDPVLVTWGNLNNEIGLPRTLLYLNAAHKAAVIEMGAGRPGDIAYLARIAEPTVGIVTNAARAHLQGFGSIEDVAATKGETFRCVARERHGGHQSRRPLLPVLVGTQRRATPADLWPAHRCGLPRERGYARRWPRRQRDPVHDAYASG